MCLIFTLIHVWHSIELSLSLSEYKYYKYSSIINNDLIRLEIVKLSEIRQIKIFII